MYTKDELRQHIAARRAGFSLPQSLYTSTDAYELDLKAIFQRSWLQVGIEGEIPHPGDYLTYSVGNDSIIVLRNAHGEVSAFFNTCRHRGARICGEPSGHVVRLVCPYHQWSYDLSGKLMQAPRMHASFDVGNYRLSPVRVETVAGVIFICLTDRPPDFSAFRSALEPMLIPHELHDARVAHTETMIA